MKRVIIASTKSTDSPFKMTTTTSYYDNFLNEQRQIILYEKEKFLNGQSDYLIRINDRMTKIRNDADTTKNFGVKMDDLFDIIKDNDLCIEANNTLTYSLNKVDSPIPRILIKNKAERNRHKKMMLNYKEEMAVLKQNGEYYEGCPTETAFKNENGYQLKIKVFMNSIYGVQGSRGSIIYAPDTAGAVTSQGRELISEMTWTMERLLYGTCHFYSVGELLCFLNTIKREVHPDSELLNYIDYWPTHDDIKRQMVKYIHKTKGLSNIYEDISVSMYNFIMNLDPVERVYFYYKNKAINKLKSTKEIANIINNCHIYFMFITIHINC